MKLKTLILPIAFTLGSTIAIAGGAADRWNSVPVEKQERITAKAEELGYDMSTEEGRKAFRETMHNERHEKRIARAAEYGFDITTDEGREAFREARKENRQAVHEQIQALSTEDRAALKDEMRGLSREDRRSLLKDKFGTS